jgi:hypothetical protein
MRLYLITLFAVILMATGCRHTMNNLTTLNKWLNNPSNGCIKTRSIAGVKITAKYLPPAYAILKHTEKYSSASRERIIDSLSANSDSTYTFLMTLSPDKAEEDNSSVAFKNTINMDEYAKRLLAMNFSMDNCTSLIIDNKKYAPVISIVENTYEMSNSRNFLIVFLPDRSSIGKGKECLFFYNDPFFDMGNVQLSFSMADIRKSQTIPIE